MLVCMGPVPAAWSPFGGDKPKKKEPPRSRGRRRRRFQAAPDDPDAVLTDRDASHAAETAMLGRERPQEPAWKRFAAEPVHPARRSPDAADTVLKLAAAGQDRAQPVIPADTRRRDELLRMQRRAPDYGTGPAFDISRMS